MEISSILPLLSAVVVFFLGVIVFKYAKHSSNKISFLIFSLFVFVWMFGTFMMFYNKDNIELVLFWDRIVYTGVVFIPVSMLSFGFSLINKQDRRSNIIIKLGYALSFLFFCLVPTKNFLGAPYVYSWGAHAKALIIHDIFLIYFAIYISMWFVFIVKYYKSLRESIERERIKYALIAFVQFAILGPLGFFAAYGIDIYPFSYISGLIFTIIIGYSIASYRLMDIKLVLRQSTVFLASLIATVLPVFIIKYMIQRLSADIAYWSEIVILMVAAILFPIFKERISKFANKYLFTSLYDSKQIISTMTDVLASTLDVNFIYEHVAKTFAQAFHSKSISFWDYNDAKHHYALIYEEGMGKWGLRIKGSKNILHKFFIKGIVVSIEELRNSGGRYGSFIKDFEKLGIEIMVPLVIKDRLVGVMAFGAKESGDIYNSEDFELLKVVASQVAISLENALLYEETKQFNVKLTKEVESATKDLRQANEELKNLDRAKSEFISIASHQLRTPLTVIKGYGSMMLEGTFGKMEPAIQENMKKIYESNERLIALVEDLLNVSRIESGKLQFNYETCQLEEIVASVYEELTSTAKAKNLEFIYNPPAQKLSPVYIDKNKIRQVIINVVDNAIKYTKQGTVTVTLSEADGQIKFQSKDTGMGIEPSDLINLFQKFSRGEHVSVLHTEGTGLGLYVGKMMIEAHKGKIWAESEGVDKGAQFYFTIPIAK